LKRLGSLAVRASALAQALLEKLDEDLYLRERRALLGIERVDRNGLLLVLAKDDLEIANRAEFTGNGGSGA
jgi:hypothetical protein